MSEEANVTVMTATEDQPDFRPIHGRIVTGMPLSVAAQKRIVQRFETLLGRHVRLSLYVDKTLIAGVRVELNGCSYDGSVLGQLSSVRKVLTRPDEEDL